MNTDDLIPNEPPESGGVSSRNFAPGKPSAAATTACKVNGPWKFAHAVSVPLDRCQSQTTP